MPHIPYATEETIPAECKSVLREFEEAHGRTSHIFRVLAHHPVFLKTAWKATREINVKPGKLARWVKEAILVITATTQQAEYCWQGHSNTLQRQGLSEDQVKDIQQHTFSAYSEPERSIFRFSQNAAFAPQTLTTEDYEGLRKVGLDDETILEVLSIVWLNTAMNMVVNALGVERSPEQMSELKLEPSAG